MDQDFSRLCQDYEEICETIQLLQQTSNKSAGFVQSQIASNTQLKNELSDEIVSFIKEEQSKN